MAIRINVILPDATVHALNRLARPGQRSRFIQRSVEHFIATAGPEALRARLRVAAIRDRDLDHEIARDWFAVDQGQWQQLEHPEKPARARGRKEAKSTSRRSTPR